LSKNAIANSSFDVALAISSTTTLLCDFSFPQAILLVFDRACTDGRILISACCSDRAQRILAEQSLATAIKVLMKFVLSGKHSTREDYVLDINTATYSRNSTLFAGRVALLLYTSQL